MFSERANIAISNAKRHGLKLGVMFIDLDHFKQINDTYGHHVGDLVLSEVSQRLMKCLRESDVVARQGGDEFLVMLAGGSSHSAFLPVARKILAALAPPVAVENAQIQIGASIGISCFPEHGTHLEALIEKADAAMYRAKRQGRNNAMLWNESPMP